MMLTIVKKIRILQGGWNPLLTNCVLREFEDEIFGDHRGCSFLEYLIYFGHFPKRAGWSSKYTKVKF